MSYLFDNVINKIPLGDASLDVLLLCLVVQALLDSFVNLLEPLAVSGLELQGDVLSLGVDEEFLALEAPLLFLFVFYVVLQSCYFTLAAFGEGFLVGLEKFVHLKKLSQKMGDNVNKHRHILWALFICFYLYYLTYNFV